MDSSTTSRALDCSMESSPEALDLTIASRERSGARCSRYISTSFRLASLEPSTYRCVASWPPRHSHQVNGANEQRECWQSNHHTAQGHISSIPPN
jgi:hypothetical protein